MSNPGTLFIIAMFLAFALIAHGSGMHIAYSVASFVIAALAALFGKDQ